MRLITLDGNIGAGKSTVLEVLRKEPGFHVYPEPVELWQDQLLSTYLAQTPGERAHETLRLQLRVFVDRCLAPPPLEDGIAILERSPFFQQSTFIPANAQLGYLSPLDVEMLDRLYYDIADRWSIEHLYIYLQCAPELCFQRIASRLRPGEKGLSFAYVHDLHNRHEAAAQKIGATVVTVGPQDTPEDIAGKVRELILA